MTDMVERVARAIRRDKFARTRRLKALNENELLTEGELSEARAAIEAMKEPTDAMVAAIAPTRADWIGHASPALGVVERWIKATTNARLANYQAMISAALSEDTGAGRMPIYSGKNVD